MFGLINEHSALALKIPNYSRSTRSWYLAYDWGCQCIQDGLGNGDRHCLGQVKHVPTVVNGSPCLRNLWLAQGE